MISPISADYTDSRRMIAPIAWTIDLYDWL